MPAKKFIIPFAATGDKTAVPNTLQPDGTVSYAQGFGPDYELDKTVDPVNAKDVPRDQTNQVYFDVTDAIGEQQLYGVALWGADRAPYPLNARAYHTGKLWRSNVANNSGEPGVAATWDDVSIGVPADASDTVKGIQRNATQAETDAGVLDTATVTPAKMRFGVSFGVVGAGWYLVLPSWLGGWIIQSQDTGSIALSAGQIFSVNFVYPIPFTTFVYTVNASSDNQSVICSASGLTLTQYTAGFQNLLGVGASASNRIIAIGK